MPSLMLFVETLQAIIVGRRMWCHQILCCSSYAAADKRQNAAEIAVLLTVLTNFRDVSNKKVRCIYDEYAPATSG